MLELRPNCECCDRDLPPDERAGADLHLRVHVLRALRRGRLRRPLSELRRQLRAPADPPGREAGPVPGVDRARAEAAPGVCSCRGELNDQPSHLARSGDLGVPGESDGRRRRRRDRIRDARDRACGAARRRPRRPLARQRRAHLLPGAAAGRHVRGRRHARVHGRRRDLLHGRRDRRRGRHPLRALQGGSRRPGR